MNKSVVEHAIYDYLRDMAKDLEIPFTELMADILKMYADKEQLEEDEL